MTQPSKSRRAARVTDDEARRWANGNGGPLQDACLDLIESRALVEKFARWWRMNKKCDEESTQTREDLCWDLEQEAWAALDAYLVGPGAR